ncbi:MAG TPA: trigger factor, partial [Vicinamibacteria bacterium]|nr:trigger factor [Vicinamibacteria bacterium]
LCTLEAAGGQRRRPPSCFKRKVRLKVEYIEETSVRKALAFEIEAEVVDREIAARTREYAKKLKLPGFRPGKVPPEVVRKRFREQLLGDVAEAIVNRVVFDELQGRGLRPLAMPQVADLKIDEGGPMTFRAVFETLPIVELPEYRGLPVKPRTPQVRDEDVEAEIGRLREENARFDPIEGRPARKGDFALLDLSWRPAEGGKGGRDENALVEVGGEENHEGMNAALEDMAVGDARDVTLAYPADHPSSALAGKTFRYALALKGIKEKIVPVADDEFAKDLGDFDNMAELRESVRKRLLAADERRVDREVKSALVDALVARSGFEVPDALVERHMTARTENIARGLAYQGIDPRRVGVNWREYRENQREDSLKAAKADILLDQVARREGIEALDAEVDAEVSRIAQRANKSAEAVRRQMEKEGGMEALRARIREEKTLDLLKANARLDLE